MRVNFYTDILNEFIVIIIIVTMGPSPSSPQVTHFNPNDWLYAKENGYCLILKNTRTGQEVEEYDMLPKGDITMHQEMEFYEYRKAQKMHLVEVVFVRKGDSAGLCTGKDFYKIYTERIPKRLSEIDDLTFLEGLMVVRDSLIGFNEIKDSYSGQLKVTNEMIGFTPEGVVKVWINEDFKYNVPDPKTIIKGYDNHMALITLLFGVVQQSLTSKTYPEEFLSQLNTLDEGLTYDKAIDFINFYSIRYNVTIPDRLDLERRPGTNLAERIDQAEDYRIVVNQVPQSVLKVEPVDVPVRMINPTPLHPPKTITSTILTQNHISIGSALPQQPINPALLRPTNQTRTITQQPQQPSTHHFYNQTLTAPSIANNKPLETVRGHQRVHSDVIAVEVTEAGNLNTPLQPSSHELTNQPRFNRFQQNEIKEQKYKRVDSREKRDITPENSRFPLTQTIPYSQPFVYEPRQQTKEINRFLHGTGNGTFRPARLQHQSPTPNPSEYLSETKPRVQNNHLPNSDSIFQQDTLTQRIEMLTASIQKQLQESLPSKNTNPNLNPYSYPYEFPPRGDNI